MEIFEYQDIFENMLHDINTQNKVVIIRACVFSEVTYMKICIA